MSIILKTFVKSLLLNAVSIPLLFISVNGKGIDTVFNNNDLTKVFRIIDTINHNANVGWFEDVEKSDFDI